MFDPMKARRWVIQRVVELGWSPSALVNMKAEMNSGAVGKVLTWNVGAGNASERSINGLRCTNCLVISAIITGCFRNGAARNLRLVDRGNSGAVISIPLNRSVIFKTTMRMNLKHRLPHLLHGGMQLIPTRSPTLRCAPIRMLGSAKRPPTSDL